MRAQENRTVLLVEDSDDDAFFFEHAFTRARVPAQLVRVSDGSQAVAYLDRISHAATEGAALTVFLDLKMPGLSGFEVLEWIRNRKLSLDITVLSGSDDQSDMARAKALGARRYLVKPITAAQLEQQFAA